MSDHKLIIKSVDNDQVNIELLSPLSNERVPTTVSHEKLEEMVRMGFKVVSDTEAGPSLLERVAKEEK